MNFDFNLYDNVCDILPKCSYAMYSIYGSL